jgi:general nucleoside transport system permease protein
MSADGTKAVVTKVGGSRVIEEFARASIAMALALIVTFITILLTSKMPVDAFVTLLTAPISRPRTIGLWLDDAVKLTIAGLAFSLVFQAKQFSMGLQGQVYMGGVACAFVALSPIGDTWLAIPVGVFCAICAGALYGLIPGVAKAKLGANEIVSSLMLNYIAIQICKYLIRTDLAPAGSGVLTTRVFPSHAIFPALIKNSRLDIGLFFAIAAVFIVWFLLYRTVWGLKLRLVGHNFNFAEYAGIKASAIMISAMTLAGGLGGLLGAMFVQGQSFGKLTVLFEGNLTFEGILVTIIARDRPFAIPIVALLYGYLRQGAQLMNIRSDVPAEIIGVVTSLIMLLVVSKFTLRLPSFFIGRGPRSANGDISGELAQ